MNRLKIKKKKKKEDEPSGTLKTNFIQIGHFLINIMGEMIEKGFSSVDFPKMVNSIFPVKQRTINLNLKEVYAAVGISYFKKLKQNQFEIKTFQ